MTVYSNYAIAIAKLSDWFKKFAPVYQTMKRIANGDLHARFFPRFAQATGNCYEFELVY